ncbi:hypothetical protein ACFOHU_15160 [Ottowia pentelensis]|uniref:Lipoprotein transmembrane n=1 Tax=Ottowia pentelensis TaxID=511108 RepID=A0ABV6PQQ3_9BURK
MSARAARVVLAAVAALALSACALFADPSRIAPGTPEAQVLATLGRPTAQYPAAAGQPARLQYSYQPSGQRVFNLDLDAQGRVTQVEQALDEGRFARRIQTDRWMRADVLREYGAPARIEAVHNFKGQIWVWRYAMGPVWRLLYIDIDPEGVVRGWSLGDENVADQIEPGSR